MTSKTTFSRSVVWENQSEKTIRQRTDKTITNGKTATQVFDVGDRRLTETSPEGRVTLKLFDEQGRIKKGVKS